MATGRKARAHEDAGAAPDVAAIAAAIDGLERDLGRDEQARVEPLWRQAEHVLGAGEGPAPRLSRRQAEVLAAVAAAGEAGYRPERPSPRRSLPALARRGLIEEVAERPGRYRITPLGLSRLDGPPLKVAAADGPDPLLLARARVLYHALDLFGSKPRATRWLVRPNVALGGVRSLALLGAVRGVKQVDDILGRIEYGGYS